ncbi:MAG: SDR family oxidoreductase [Candidatus Omnitrophota bacterium]|nr:SDR family oxidoreductase [Candidatus Omnitrophota bacterium]
MNAIVTGGAGFIGAHLVERLLGDGHRVVVLDNLSTGRVENLNNIAQKSNLSFFDVDISNFDSISGYFKGIDWVFHLAALADIVPSIVEPQRYHRSNVDGTIAVLEAARQNKVKKLVYAASSSCYGIAEVCPTPETAQISPQYPYALTKYIGELYALHWAKVYKLPVISLRLFNVYGPKARTCGTYGAVLGVFLAQKLNGAPFTVVGDGSQKRDFVYVLDVAQAFIQAAMSNIEDGIFNVGSGNPQSINKLVSLLGGEKTHIPKRPGEPDCTWADINKIKEMLGWQPRTSFEEGISLVLEDIDYWKGAVVWTPEKVEEATRDWFKYLAR